MIKQYSIFLIVIAFVIGCDKGLSPVQETKITPGFGGKIHFISSVPKDSLFELRVVAVPYYPIDTSVSTFIFKVMTGEIKYSDPISTASIDSGTVQNYSVFVTPTEYKYVAIVQRYGSDLFLHWRVISVYSDSALYPTPKNVIINENQFRNNIDFKVDFKNLPPQPFK